MIIEVDFNVDCIFQVAVLPAHHLDPTALGVVRLEAAREHVLLFLIRRLAFWKLSAKCNEGSEVSLLSILNHSQFR